MIRAVLFDFDGTIANTLSALREGVNLTMEQFGYPSHTESDILRFINNGARELIRRAMPERLQNDQDLVDRVLLCYNRQLAKVFLHTDRAYDGIPELIRDLHNVYNCRVGILSNKQDLFLKKLCEQVLLPGTYDAAQGVVPGKPTKPDRFLSDRIARMLGVQTEECALVGDSDVDILTAQNAGMFHIGVAWGFRSVDFLLAHGAARIANTPPDVLRILLESGQIPAC